MIPSPPQRRKPGSFRNSPRGGDACDTFATHPLEQDGVVPSLYAAIVKMHLHAQRMAPGGNERQERKHNAARDEGHPCASLPLPIPDTVVYERNFPQGWYHLDKRDRTLSKLPGGVLDASAIVTAFKRTAAAAGGICAQFVTAAQAEKSDEPKLRENLAAGPSATFAEDGRTPSPRAAGSMGTEDLFASNPHATDHVRASWDEKAIAEQAREIARRERGGGQLHVVYLDTADLEDFAFCRGRFTHYVRDGLLQRFVPPRAASNDLLQVVWSPHTSFVQRAINTNKVQGRVPDSRLKAATFDGPAHLSSVAPVNAAMRDRLVQAAERLGRTLLHFEHKVLSRIVLFCKQDRAGDLWLLFAGSMRVADAAGVPTVKRPRLPLRMPDGDNFTPAVRQRVGTHDAYIDAEVQRDVAHNDLAPKSSSGKGPVRSILAAGCGLGQSSGQQQGWRVLRGTQRAPQIRAPTLFDRRASRDPPSALGSPPAGHAPLSARSRQFFRNLVYELSAARGLPPSLVASSASSPPQTSNHGRPVVEVPEYVVEELGERACQEVLTEALELRATANPRHFADSTLEAVCTASDDPTIAGWKGEMLRGASIHAAQKKATPCATLARRVEAMLGSTL